ncbi:restriction endonuclease, partial [Streptomyces sp. SID7499]|nr:restriction endonuclease [Streptomyces sp. SID7499]
IMGDYESHRKIARALQLPAPREGEFVSAQVKEVNYAIPSENSVSLSGKLWTLASPGDAPEVAPQLPSHKR